MDSLDAVLQAGFAPHRTLEPSEADVIAVLGRAEHAPRRGGVGERVSRLGRARFGVQPRLRGRLDGGGLVVVAGGLIAVLVVVLVVALGRSSEQQAASRDQAVRALVARLAVLRRPQTAADRLPAGTHVNLGLGPSGELIPSLTRLVAVLPQARVYLAVANTSLEGGPIAEPGAGLIVVPTDRPAQAPAFANGVPAEFLNDPRFVRSLPLGDGQDLEAEIVPDGVVRVRWRLREFDGDRAGPLSRQADVRGRVRSLVADVTDNVALRVVGDAELVAPARWYWPDGQPYPTSERAFDAFVTRQLSAAHATALRHAESAPSSDPRTILHAFPLFSPAALGRHRDGVVISHPPLSALPTVVLNMAGGNGGGPGVSDIREVRQVRSSFGQTFWFVPGSHGLCEVSAITSSITGAYAQGGGSGCSPSVANALMGGAGVSQYRDGVEVAVGVISAHVSAMRIVRNGRPVGTTPVTDGFYAVRGKPDFRLEPVRTSQTRGRSVR